MRRPAAVVVSAGWGLAVGGTFGCLLPWLLGYWHFDSPLPYWTAARVVGGLLFGSRGLLVYTAVAWCVGAAAVRFYEEPTLSRKFGTAYQDYRHHVRAWIPRLHPWTPPGRPAAAGRDQDEGRSAMPSG